MQVMMTVDMRGADSQFDQSVYLCRYLVFQFVSSGFAGREPPERSPQARKFSVLVDN